MSRLAPVVLFLLFYGSASVASAAEPHDALAEVNALRQYEGLRPFIRDDGLTRGAFNLAKWRADRLIEGHTNNDWGGLPAGIRPNWSYAGGCAACEPNRGFRACCVYDNYRYAGAASCLGRDGRVYHYIFVRR